MSIALYDAVMVAVDRLWPSKDKLIANAEIIRSETVSLLSNEETSTILTGQGNTANTIKQRIDLISSMMIAVSGI